MEMDLTTRIAKHFRAIHFGGNWTDSNVKDSLSDITWKQASTKLDGFNTIAALTFHINYYVSTVLKVLAGGPLDAHDKYSFDVSPIASPKDWKNLVDKVLSDAENLAQLIEQLPESQLWEIFCQEKYGNYYDNFQGILEHSHYHLGQIVILKKLILQKEQAS